MVLLDIYKFYLGNHIFKGSVRENEGGYRLTVKNKRFWSLLILLLSVASIRGKLLKTEERYSVHLNSESCNIRLHPRLTRVSSIRFLLFEINRVLFYIFQQSFNLRICLFYTFSFKIQIPTKKWFRKKAKIYV